MTTPVWQSGTLYNPGALVIPQSAPPVVQSAPDNPDFESGASGWTLDADFTIGQFGYAYIGTWSLRWTAQTQGYAVNDNEVPVTPGQIISANCVIQQRGTSTNTSQGLIQINWYDASHAFISRSEGNGVGSNGHNIWRHSGVTAAAPAGAAYARIGCTAYRSQASATQLYFDNFTWDYTFATAPEGLVYKAVQADAGFSGASEPTWPIVAGNTVVDNEVTWEAVIATRVVWEATPILVSGSTEPTWPTTVGGNVLDNTINWRATSRRVTDAKCPQSPYVVIAASKIFAADEDIIRYSTTVNCLDWSTADDAGYLPFGLQTYGASPVKAMGLYRSNLVAFNAEGFQMWQVDQDPASMALLDAVPVGSQYHEALQPLANDLIFTSDVGARNVGIAGASTNLQAEGIGEPIDPLVQAALDEGVYSPLGVLWPAAGQYWLVFGDEAFVLTVNGTKKKSWSRYTFPEVITDWTLHEGVLHLRTEADTVWKVTAEALGDDEIGGYSEPIVGVVHWPFLDLNNPGANKQLVGFDVTTDAPEGVSVSIGYNQRDISQRTADYEVPADTLDGSMIAMPLNAPSFDLKLTFEPDQEWEFFAANLYVNDGRRG